MARYALYPYHIRIHERGTTRYVNLNNIRTNNGNRTLFQILNAFFNQYTTTPYQNEDRQKTFHVDELHTQNNQLLYGFIKSGEYGYSGDFFNVENNRLTRDARTVNDSEELPFLFMIDTQLSRTPEIGILLLQKFKNLGTKSILHNSMSQYIEDLGDFKLSINPILSSELIRKLESADKVVKLRLIKREVSRDVAERHLIDNSNDVYEERVFRIKSRREFDGINFLSNLSHSRIIDELRNIEYPYVEIQGEHYDEIKIETVTSGSSETIFLGNNSRFREKYLIREGRLNLENGHPTLPSISEIGVEYMNHILENHVEQPISLEDMGE